MLEEPLEGVLKHRLLGLSPRVSRSVGPGWGQEISVCNMFLGWGTALAEPLLWKHL